MPLRAVWPLSSPCSALLAVPLPLALCGEMVQVTIESKGARLFFPCIQGAEVLASDGLLASLHWLA